jgi:hypothetical protein
VCHDRTEDAKRSHWIPGTGDGEGQRSPESRARVARE